MKLQSWIARPTGGQSLRAAVVALAALCALAPAQAAEPGDFPLPGAGPQDDNGDGTTPPLTTGPQAGAPDDPGSPPDTAEPRDIPPPSERRSPPRQAEQPAPKEKADVVPSSPEEREKLLKHLYKNLAASSSSSEAEAIAQSIEKIWAVSGSATADLLADRALAAAHAGNRDLALKLLDTTVTLQPDFAEAWNRRAFVYYMNNDYKHALGDLRRVLALDPNHFKALDGLARMLRDIGEKKASYEAFQNLIKVYPYAPGAKEALQELKVEVEGQGI